MSETRHNALAEEECNRPDSSLQRVMRTGPRRKRAGNVMIWLADAVLVLHALIVLFIVGGLIAIWSGAALKHVWVRNRAFRVLHLVAIGVVAILAALGVPCPLTVIEDHLRTGGAVEQGFVQRWVSHWLYYDVPAWMFAVAYVAFLLIVAITWRCIPPRR
jgi:hypothetical protein